MSLELNRYVALRGDFTFARNELRTDGVDTGNEMDRYLCDAALQVRYPFDSGLTPYLFLGAGGATLDPVGTDGDRQTKGTATPGLGTGYTFPGTGLGMFVEGQGWLFRTKDLDGMMASYDKTQFDLAWSVGLFYRLRS